MPYSDPRVRRTSRVHTVFKIAEKALKKVVQPKKTFNIGQGSAGGAVDSGADDTASDTVYTGTAPIEVSGTVISIDPTGSEDDVLTLQSGVWVPAAPIVHVESPVTIMLNGSDLAAIHDTAANIAHWEIAKHSGATNKGTGEQVTCAVLNYDFVNSHFSQTYGLWGWAYVYTPPVPLINQSDLAVGISIKRIGTPSITVSCYCKLSAATDFDSLKLILTDVTDTSKTSASGNLKAGPDGVWYEISHTFGYTASWSSFLMVGLEAKGKTLTGLVNGNCKVYIDHLVIQQEYA